MAKFTFITPLVVGLVALTGCPGDDSGADTENGEESTGTAGDTIATPVTMTTAEPTTTGADSSSGDPPDTSTTGGMICEPACGADECCVEGLCFSAPEPSCEPGCEEDELCEFPEGADPCTDAAVCVPDVGLCPGGWGAGNYDTCLNEAGMADTALCEMGSICVQDGDPPSVTVCAAQACTEMCDCPEPPATGDAPVTCADQTNDMINDCYLSCEDDETCPGGMTCFGGFICAWPVPQPTAGYFNCSLTGFNCQAGEDCLQDGDGGMMAATWAVCSEPGCMTEMDCQFDPPTSGEALVACGDPMAMGGADSCYLDCAAGETCPDGMTCTADSFCSWPAGDTLFFDDFQTADFSMGWTLIDVDAQTPADPVAYVTDAWVVNDQLDGGAGGNLAAYSNSWYNPPGQADDWMISPQIMIGANAQVQWRARTQDPGFPDGYEVRISTAGPDIVDFEANAPIFTIAAENAGADYTFRTLDLAAEGYADQMIYLAWRNNSNDQFVLLVDDIAVVDFP